ncbi:TetR/AcrR family transcriptional regulator [Salininema proteolyticum]|uniref:TetR/AcrR family transcriptional regulator n=1 Tax=Salininema proteolyticum TaxID=1607685 RepID=A0ABV8U1Y8_9ACTN
MPEELARLWRIPAESKKGRPAKLDTCTVVSAAVALADAEGMDAVTLPRVAADLGVTKMSLYRYVGSKDELLVHMQDHAFGPAPERGDAGWREELKNWAFAQAEVMAEHPWLMDLPVSGPPRGPNAIDWLDAALSALRGTGLGVSEKLGIVTVVSTYARSSRQMSAEMASERSAGTEQVEAEREWQAALFELVDPERYPEAAGLMAEPVFEPAGEDAEFLFGLDLILDGVAVIADEK